MNTTSARLRRAALVVGIGGALALGATPTAAHAGPVCDLVGKVVDLCPATTPAPAASPLPTTAPAPVPAAPAPSAPAPAASAPAGAPAPVVITLAPPARTPAPKPAAAAPHPRSTVTLPDRPAVDPEPGPFEVASSTSSAPYADVRESADRLIVLGVALLVALAAAVFAGIGGLLLGHAITDRRHPRRATHTDTPVGGEVE